MLNEKIKAQENRIAGAVGGGTTGGIIAERNGQDLWEEAITLEIGC